MRLGIDCWILTNMRCSGARTQLLALLQNIPKIDKKNTYVLFFDGQVDSDFKDKNGFYKMVTLHPSLISRKLKTDLAKTLIWLNFTLPLALKREKIDLCFYPLNIMPIWSRVPGVIFIHDMGAYVIKINNRATLPHQYFFRLFIHHSVRKTKYIGVPSFDTKNDVIHYLKVKGERIRVIHHGISEHFKVIKNKEVIREGQKKFGLGSQVIMFVGHMDERRENPFFALQIFSSLVKNPGLHNYELAIIGEFNRHTEKILEAIERSPVRNQIKILGPVKHEEMVLLYNHANILIFPSLHESFGFPMMEAMACGTPVVAPNVAAIPEIAGDAAILLDPNDLEAWVDTVSNILTDTFLHQDLRKKGLERVKKFSVENMTRKTVKTFMKAVEK